MKTKKQTYEPPRFIEYSVKYANDGICATSTYNSSLQKWEEEDI